MNPIDENIPSYRKVAPIKIPPRTDREIKPKDIFEGVEIKRKPPNQKKPKSRKQKKKGPKRDKSRK